MDAQSEQEYDPELEEKKQNAWKSFGRESDVGKLLFSLYKTGKPAQINYPKPKQKKPQPEVPKEPKHCPQKQIIDYPEPEQKEIYFDKTLLIPKRKPQNKIQDEIDSYYSKPDIPVNRGQNRVNLINQLQTKFKYSKGILPDKASLPIDEQEVKRILNDPKIKEKAKQKLNKYNQSQMQESKPQISDEDQLTVLFQQILEEIEERQKFLQSIEGLKEPELKKRIKQEIVERVSELQKVTELQKKVLKN